MKPRSTDCQADAPTTTPSGSQTVRRDAPVRRFNFPKDIAEYFGFMPLSLGFIASKEL